MYAYLPSPIRCPHRRDGLLFPNERRIAVAVCLHCSMLRLTTSLARGGDMAYVGLAEGSTEGWGASAERTVAECDLRGYLTRLDIEVDAWTQEFHGSLQYY